MKVRSAAAQTCTAAGRSIQFTQKDCGPTPYESAVEPLVVLLTTLFLATHVPTPSSPVLEPSCHSKLISTARGRSLGDET